MSFLKFPTNLRKRSDPLLTPRIEVSQYGSKKIKYSARNECHQHDIAKSSPELLRERQCRPDCNVQAEIECHRYCIDEKQPAYEIKHEKEAGHHVPDLQ